MNVIDYLKNEDIHFIECKNWNNIYGYEKSQMKKDTINYIEQLQRENKHLDKVNCHLRKNYGQLEKENQGLKKQLQIKHDGFMASTDELCECAVENDRLKNQLNEYKNRLNKINIVMYSPNCEEQYITYISFDYLKCKKFIEEYIKYNKYKSYNMFILKNVELEKKLLHFL